MTFNHQLEKIKKKKIDAEKEREQKKKLREKMFKHKIRKAHQLNRKTNKGQLKMSGQISHLLDKITR